MNPNQSKFIEALEIKLKEINDPNPDIITHEGYQYSLRHVKKYKRKLIWITFTPYGSDTRIKAEIMRKAGININDAYKEKLLKCRKKHGIESPLDKDNRILARWFKQYWDSYWNDKAKAIETLKDPQERFTKSNETIAEPIRRMMDLPDPDPGINPEPEPESKSYTEELMEVD